MRTSYFVDVRVTKRDASRRVMGRPSYTRRLWTTCALLALAACGRSTLSTQPQGDGGAPPIGNPMSDGGDEGGPGTCGVPRLGPFEGRDDVLVRELVTEGTTATGSNLLSGPCGGSGPEVVVEWVSPFTGLVFFDTFGSSIDTVLYTAPNTDLDVCEPTRASGGECNDNATGAVFESELSLFVTEGQPLFLVVDSHDAGGRFVLNVRYSLLPFEFDCDNGTDDDLDGRVDCADSDCSEDPSCRSGCDAVQAGSDLGEQLIRSSTVGAGNDYAASCGGNLGNDEVILWTAPFTGRFVVDTRGSSFDTVLYAAEIDADCRPTVELAGGCNDDISPDALDSALTLNLVEGQEIALVVDGYGIEAGDYLLSIDGARDLEVCDNGVDDNGDGRVDCDDSSCAANPLCQSTPCPALIAEPVGTTEGSSMQQADRFGSECGGGRAPELTLSWTAPRDGPFRFDTVGSQFDTVLSIFGDTSACSTPSQPELICNDDTQDLWSELTLMAEAGRTYLVVIDGWGPDDSGDAVLRVTDLAPPAPESDCDDGVDNDADGDVDCDDDDCAIDPACQTPSRETRCQNGLDDDGDGDVDCDDDDCAARPACLPGPETACENGLDDDGDGDVDCDDDDCAIDAACAVAECWDSDLGSAVGLRAARGSTVGAGNDAGASCGGGFAPERLLRWTAPEGGTYQFDTFGSQYDTVLYLWAETSGCTAAEIAGTCNDDARQSFQSLVTLEVTAGQSLYVVVDGYDNRSGNYNLNIQRLREDDTRERNCFNGIDDDNDGAIDCNDPDCDSDCEF